MPGFFPPLHINKSTFAFLYAPTHGLCFHQRRDHSPYWSRTPGYFLPLSHQHKCIPSYILWNLRRIHYVVCAILLTTVLVGCAIYYTLLTKVFIVYSLCPFTAIKPHPFLLWLRHTNVPHFLKFHIWEVGIKNSPYDLPLCTLGTEEQNKRPQNCCLPVKQPFQYIKVCLKR